MSSRTGRRRRTIPGYVSIEIASFRSIAASFKNDAEFGRWVKKAFDDMSIGCILDDTDPRIRAIYTDAVERMEYEYKRKKEWEERKNKENEKKTENPVERPTKSDSKGPGDLVYGSCENVFLTQDEFNKIAMDVGNLKEANSLVEDLSLNLADGKIESSNHFATLQKWAKWRKNHPNDERLETFHERDDRNQIETMRRVFSM